LSNKLLMSCCQNVATPEIGKVILLQNKSGFFGDTSCSIFNLFVSLNYDIWWCWLFTLLFNDVVFCAKYSSCPVLCCDFISVVLIVRSL